MQQAQTLPIGRLLPANEAQARPLTSLPPDEQVQAWEAAVTSAPEGVVTARHVQESVDTLKAHNSPVPVIAFLPDTWALLTVASSQLTDILEATSDTVLPHGKIKRPVFIEDAFWCVVELDRRQAGAPTLNDSGNQIAYYAVRVYRLDDYIDERLRRQDAGEVAFPPLIDIFTWQTEVRDRKRAADNVFGLKVALTPPPRMEEPNTSAWWVLTDYKARLEYCAERPATTQTPQTEPFSSLPEPEIDTYPTDETGMAALIRSLSGTLVEQGQCAPPVLLDGKLWTTLTLHRNLETGRDAAGVAEVVERHFWPGEAFAVSLWKQQIANKEREAGDYQGLAVKSNPGGKVYVLTGVERVYFYQGRQKGQADVETSPTSLRPDPTEASEDWDTALERNVRSVEARAAVSTPLNRLEADQALVGQPVTWREESAPALPEDEPGTGEDSDDDKAWHNALREVILGLGGNEPEMDDSVSLRDYWTEQFQSYLEICAEQSGYIHHLQAVKQAAEKLDRGNSVQNAKYRLELDTALQACNAHVKEPTARLDFLERALGKQEMALLRRLSERPFPLVGKITPKEYLHLKIRQWAQQYGIDTGSDDDF